METIHIALTVLFVVMTFLFAVFIFNREVRNGIIMEDFREDFKEHEKSIRSCTPADAEELIDRFYKKWEPYVPYFTLVDHTHILYQSIISKN
jgi:hypothetical protein